MQQEVTKIMAWNNSTSNAITLKEDQQNFLFNYFLIIICYFLKGEKFLKNNLNKINKYLTLIIKILMIRVINLHNNLLTLDHCRHNTNKGKEIQIFFRFTSVIMPQKQLPVCPTDFSMSMHSEFFHEDIGQLDLIYVR